MVGKLKLMSSAIADKVFGSELAQEIQSQPVEKKKTRKRKKDGEYAKIFLPLLEVLGRIIMLIVIFPSAVLQGMYAGLLKTVDVLKEQM